MERNILSKKEDDSFSERVIKYNNDSVKDEKEKEYIRGRTKNLVYRICKERLFLDDDMISSVYISFHYDMDRIISAYRIAEKSFNHYLRQVCIYRLRRALKKEQTPFYLEMEYSAETEDYYTLDNPDEKDDDGDDYLSPSQEITEFSTMGMKEISEYIIKHNDAARSFSSNRKENALKKRLDESRYFRRNFLFFILSLPVTENRKDAENYARLFSTDESAFTKLLDLKNEYVRHNKERREKNLVLAAKHWRIMAKLKNSMYKAVSKTEYNVIRENYMSQVRCHRNRLRDAVRLRKGIIHDEIASVLGHSRTTVSMGIKQVRETLEDIVKYIPG